MQVYVGEFSVKDLSEGRDKSEVKLMMAKTGLKYTNTKLVKRKGEIVGIKIWVCDAESMIM